jgi:hypothetical protein
VIAPAVPAPITAAERHKLAPPRGHAASLMLGAARLEAEAADDRRDNSDADTYRAQALAPLSADLIVPGVGGELVPTDSGKGAAEWQLLNTLENPSYVTADASRARLDLAQQAALSKKPLMQRTRSEPATASTHAGASTRDRARLGDEALGRNEPANRSRPTGDSAG